VGALVDRMTADETGVTLVNLSPTQPRTLVVQGGGYGEHRIREIRSGEVRTPVGGSTFTVRLAPGAGMRLVLAMDRYANAPTLAFPWNR
jgi:hypothetical protein